jgi:hypothetical protein
MRGRGAAVLSMAVHSNALNVVVGLLTRARSSGWEHHPAMRGSSVVVPRIHTQSIRNPPHPPTGSQQVEA